MTIVRHIIDPATGQAIFVTPDDPTTVGLDGAIGSLANIAGGGRYFSKFGGAVTDWLELGAGAGGGGGTGAVSSVFGRTGNVISQSGDYSYSQLSGIPSTFTPAPHIHSWFDIQSSKPTTIAGYGITDFNSLGDARWARLAAGNVFGGAIAAPSITSNLPAASVGWWQLANVNSSPVASALQFGSDGTGWSFEIGKNIGGVYSGIIRVYDYGLVTLPTLYASLVRVTGTYGFLLGEQSGVGRIRYAATATSSFDFITNLDGYADLYGHNFNTVSGAFIAKNDGWGMTLLPVSLGAPTYIRFMDNAGSSRRAYIGLGAGSSSSADLYINSDSGAIKFQSNGGVPVASMSTSGITAIDFILS